MSDPGYSVLFVLNTDAPPDMGSGGGKGQRTIQEIRHPLCSLGEYLKRMPRSPHHDLRNLDDVGVWDFRMEQIAHGIHEDSLWRFPPKWFAQLLGYQSQIKALSVGMVRNPPETFGKYFGIAMFATRTDLGAAAHGIPRGVCPFNRGFLCHIRPFFASELNPI